MAAASDLADVLLRCQLAIQQDTEITYHVDGLTVTSPIERLQSTLASLIRLACEPKPSYICLGIFELQSTRRPNTNRIRPIRNHLVDSMRNEHQQQLYFDIKLYIICIHVIMKSMLTRDVSNVLSVSGVFDRSKNWALWNWSHEIVRVRLRISETESMCAITQIGIKPFGESVSDEWGYEKNQSAFYDRLAVFFATAWPYFFLGLLTSSRISFSG